ncbi:hypothetical protein FXO38_22518 [Capsicum annuum]|uniref:Uncharacterized protein n=1 Tax=Capsicum annuum TaxID=4072 RepID=A0A2G3A829_CAPAN|nr:hypothetical protein FXO37_29374 [Capsicum annuum]KAF3639695.1 hypothetical protein FXO38_22518 [Capsicum annuum]PHT90333.1 hypothetical protein T459_05446 [Capsicum annuum]
MELEGAELLYVFREQNKVADRLTREGRKASTFGITMLLQVPPVFVQQTLEVDTLETYSVRLVKNNSINLLCPDVTGNSHVLTPAHDRETTLP